MSTTAGGRRGSKLHFRHKGLTSVVQLMDNPYMLQLLCMPYWILAPAASGVIFVIVQACNKAQAEYVDDVV